MQLRCHPLTQARWSDLERLFGRNGACGGCWCMLWRLPRKQFEAQKGDGNRKALRALVAAGQVPGLLGYLGGQPVGWCALAPRGDYPALGRSRVLAPVDHARKQRARILEGYPVEPRGERRIPAAFAWTGVPRAFEAVGFTEVARRSPTRPIMRLDCRQRRGPQ
jgi:hypothetical protein